MPEKNCNSGLPHLRSDMKRKCLRTTIIIGIILTASQLLVVFFILPSYTGINVKAPGENPYIKLQADLLDVSKMPQEPIPGLEVTRLQVAAEVVKGKRNKAVGLPASIVPLTSNGPRVKVRSYQIEKGRLWRYYSQAILNCITGRFYQVRPKHHSQSRLDTHNATLVEDTQQRKSAFSDIFDRKLWGAEHNVTARVSGSGPGSTVKATESIRRLLGVVVNQLKIILGTNRIRMLDIPCGDMAWMPVFLSERNDVDYTGMDIVPALIDNHQHYFRHNTSMRFITQDIAHTPLQHSYDVIFSRQMTQHLTTADTMSVLRHFNQSGSHFLLATTVPTWSANVEVNITQEWRYRYQNLMIPPYGLDSPVCMLPESQGRDVMALWTLPFV